MGTKQERAASEAALQQRITGVCQIQGRRYGKLEGAPLNMAREGILRHFRACDRMEVLPCASAIREIIDDALAGRAIWRMAA